MGTSKDGYYLSRIFLMALLVLAVGWYAPFAVNFDDERYVFKGATELSWENAQKALAEEQDITIYDSDPTDGDVLLIYDFHMKADGPPPYALSYLDYTVDRDPRQWMAFGVGTFLAGSVIVATSLLLIGEKWVRQD